MITPRVHMNGTDRKTLVDGFETAARAVLSALTELREIAPNGRDYYPISDDAIVVAMREHKARVDALQTVYGELLALYASVDA